MEIFGIIEKPQGRISISGRFDFVVHREFKSQYMRMLADAQIREIEVNLQCVDYMDSAALGMLMLLNERAHAVNKSVVLCYPSVIVSRLLDVANFSRMFSIKGLNADERMIADFRHDGARPSFADS